MLTPILASIEKCNSRSASCVVLSVGCALSLCAPERAFSQTQGGVENAVRQAEGLRQQAEQREKATSAAPAAESDGPPETYPGENADLGPQVLLKQKPKAKPLFEVSADTMFTWSSNAKGETENPKQAGIVAETFSLAIAPEPIDLGPGKLGLRAGYRHLFWMYDIWKSSGSINAYNFEMSSGFLSSNFSFAENWNASLGLDYNRIMNDGWVKGRPTEWTLPRILDPSKWTESYTEWNPTWSLSRNIPVGEKAGVTLGYNGGYHFTRIDQNDGGITSNAPRTWSLDHLDNGVSFIVNYPFRKWIFQEGLRFTHSIYTQPQSAGGHRMDRTISPSLTAIWSPTQRWSLRVSLGGEFKHSNNTDTPNYHKFEGSTGVTFTYKF